MTRDRLPALDGIRGLALTIVVVFHVHRLLPSPAPSSSLAARLAGKAADAGWCGVELFFVLSGFLITTGLLDARRRGEPAVHFYVRRVIRIVPAYYAFLLVLFTAAPLLAAAPEEAATLRANQPWYWTFLVDVLVFRHGWEATPLHTGHLWSIAIEAHYYACWPIAVRHLDRRGLRTLCAGLFVASGVGRALMLLAGSPATAVYAFTATHLEGLAAGGWLALAPFDVGSDPSWRRRLGLAAGAGALGFVTLGALRETLQPSDPIVALFGIPCAALIATGFVGLRPFAHVLSHPALTTIGGYSYAAYLFHDPIALVTWRALAGTRVATSHIVIFAVVAALTAVASAASAALVERPAARWRRAIESDRARAGT